MNVKAFAEPSTIGHVWCFAKSFFIEVSSRAAAPVLLSLKHGMSTLLGDEKLALAFCLVGRAFDFATTWVALSLGCATEAKPGAAEFIESAGPWMGLIVWEFAITTPVIFLGCTLAKKTCSRRLPLGEDATKDRKLSSEIPLFYSIGVISFIVGLHNCGYIL